MQCPKCGRETPDLGRFCIRCHATLRFVCPCCQHVQTRAGACESCGIDFEKYADLLRMQVVSAAERERARRKSRAEVVRQAALLPVTGGLSLVKYLYDHLLSKETGR